MLAGLIAALRKKQVDLAVATFRNPGDLTSERFARVVGQFEGIEIALGLINTALDGADKRDKEL